MSDLISRQSAIEVASRECHELRGLFSDIEHGLKELPSAQKTGHWRRIPMACYGGGTIIEYECSECEEHNIIDSDFCPNCGSYNGGDSDELRLKEKIND